MVGHLRDFPLRSFVDTLGRMGELAADQNGREFLSVLGQQDIARLKKFIPSLVLPTSEAGVVHGEPDVG
jgi:hypothetical protein